MILDGDDALEFPCIRGDLVRQKSLEQISKQYTFEVLITLFQSHFILKNFKECISFLKNVKNIQPKILDFLSPKDLKLIIGRQTDAALNSHSVMYELLCTRDERVNPVANYEGKDYNY
jgi:hypothetical protein